MADPAVALLQSFVAALNRRSRRDANEAAFALIAMAAPLRDKWRLLAQVLRAHGELGAANEAMRLLVEQSGGSASARFEQASLAAQSGRLEHAREFAKGVPADVPDRARHAYLLGTMALNLGEVEAAERHLSAALDSNPLSGQAMLALASSRVRAPDDPIARRILGAASAMAGAPQSERAQYHYAAGRIWFDRKEADRAFAEFAAGAALVSVERPYDGASDAASAALAPQGYDRPMIASINDRIEIDTSDAIIVTGLPRSGTTLVEHVLASHSQVGGGQELGVMAIVARDLPQASAAGLAACAERGGVNALAELYLHLARERFAAGRYVDKALNSSRYMGLIAALLPQSPIVWLRRDPLDCALSAFRTYFFQGLDWSWKLEDIAAHFRLEDELFSFWSDLLPDRILVVDYAELVRDPAAQIERILAHCGLPVEPQVFEPHKTARAVATASVVQVREPINRNAVGNAEPYREHMKPFIENYERK